MAFKVKNKPTKKKDIDKRITLDARYNKKLIDLENNKKDIEILNKRKDKLEKQIKKLEKEDYKKNIDKIIDIKDNLIDIKGKLDTLNSNSELDYLLDTGGLLFDYYETIENNNTKIVNNFVKKTEGKTVSDYFNIKPSKKEKSRAMIYENYLSKTNNNVGKVSDNKKIDFCFECNCEKKLFLSLGKMICERCGDETTILIDSDKPSYKDPPREISYFAYKRINHFNEWLAQFQAKETTDIPKEIYDEILVELKKERINTINSLSQKKLREILKKLKKNKYYEHIPHIINKLNGLPPPIMSRKTEEELRRMFKEIQIPFQNHCPEHRKNFLSYSYILHKFVQLLELDEFIPCFLLLKSREKLIQQDMIWKKICGDLKWQFIPSI